MIPVRVEEVGFAFEQRLGFGAAARPGFGQLLKAADHASRMFFEGTWTRDLHSGDSRESRLSAYCNLEPKWK